MDTPIIRVENVHYRYPSGIEALKGVSLEIYPGEFIAIMGENGSGKTTLIKHFNGVLKPSKGHVVVKGIDTGETSVAELSKIVGIVFQNPDHQLFAENVLEEIAFPLKNFGFSEDFIKRRVEWALKIMDLEKYSNKSPYMLSIGERKRLTIAAVLAYDPEVIVLDEPTAGQDYLQKEKISEIMNLLRLAGKTVVVVTHDVEFVVEHIDRVILMSNGHIIADGKTPEILSRIELIRKTRILPPQITRLAYLLYTKNIISTKYFIKTDEIIGTLLEILKDKKEEMR
ncbi:MAG: ABC transporter ATP-binding protein [Thermoprotei archaeon]|nr:MAG: ABC transporter ATP-binding protein [Thermoprotei archaeon]